eukprot:scpid99104/ scgid1937/ 
MVIRQLTLTTNDGRLTLRQDETTEYIIVKAYNGDKTSKCVHNGDRRRCSRMYAGVKNSAAACTTTQQHVQQRDTKAATCTTKSYTCNRMYNEETQAQPHVQHYPPSKKNIHSCGWK